jgi:UDP-3-O-[3-hydroxymyristoyl] glucosamine N-acyltransferase
MSPNVPPERMTAAEIAEATGGRVIGDASVVVTAIAPLDRAGPEDLSFLASARYAPLMADSEAGVVLVTPDLKASAGKCKARVVVDQPHDAMLVIIARLYKPVVHPTGIHPAARIGRNVLVGDHVCIEAGAVVEDDVQIGDRTWIATHSVIGHGVKIGDDCQIFPQVTMYPGTRLGSRVIVHSGTRLGSDGFGYVQKQDAGGQLAHIKIPHVGRTVIGNDVEIGANCAIDRGSVDDTVIGAGTKIDNLVHVAHNVRIGRLCLLMAQVGVAGSTRIEDGAILAGQVGVSGHLTIGAGARLAAQSGVISDVPAGETWSGYPARPHKEALRATAALFKLAPLLRRIEALLDRVKL